MLNLKQKLIQSALLWPILIISLFLSGCANTQPLVVHSEPVTRAPLNLQTPQPLRLTGPQWIVITPENADAVWAALKKDGVSIVLFAVTDEGYKELSVDYAQIRNLINEQRDIIIKYKEYYEPPTKAKEEKSLLEKYFNADRK